MAPSPYLLWVNSRPTAVDDDLWTKWYTVEHVPDLVSHGASTRAGIYKECTILAAGEEPHPRKFLAVYQTEFEESLKSKEYLGIRKTSELFPHPQRNRDNGEFDDRNYKLIQE